MVINITIKFKIDVVIFLVINILQNKSLIIISLSSLNKIKIIDITNNAIQIDNSVNIIYLFFLKIPKGKKPNLVSLLVPPLLNISKPPSIVLK